MSEWFLLPWKYKKEIFQKKLDGRLDRMKRNKINRCRALYGCFNGVVGPLNTKLKLKFPKISILQIDYFRLTRQK